MSIEVKEVTKVYGSQKALDAVSFNINQGEIVGFLGPNGAGKSTMMKIITTYLDATEGVVLVNGYDVATDELSVKKSIGYLPEHNPLYLDMYVKEYLQFNANIYKIGIDKVMEVIKTVGLSAEAHKKISQLSKGYRQRVGLAAALLHNPDVLILDEPTTGLDPNQLIEIRQLIRDIGKSKTVLFSSHILQEVEAVCDRIIIINKGKIVADKRLDSLKDDKIQRIEVEFDLLVEQQLLQQIANVNIVKNLGGNTWELTFYTKKDMRPAIFDFAHDNGLRLLQSIRKNESLEKMFRDLTQ
ncbi:MAG: gliding motility-associated ABC transporter ATP-binding subunit GldA [Flavobacteriales bacterium]|nr:MAG: gliding motility-associated ABC transporter ATP-binding subunit GldA [Flavobacteriales bacterium]